ncbi:MAG: SulP family inorganic anion transporter, partial [Agromyces sp.]
MPPLVKRYLAAFPFDAMAGLAVAIVALPLALAFGVTTGVGSTAGLTTAIVAGIVAGFFGGSNYQVSGPTGAMTVVLVPIVAVVIFFVFSSHQKTIDFNTQVKPIFNKKCIACHG